MAPMNKRELARAVAVQSDIELKTVVNVLDGFTDVVTAVVSKGEPVAITGFAKFVKVDRKARMGRNPATGEAIRIKASKKARDHTGESVQGRGVGSGQGAEAEQGRLPDRQRRGRRRRQVVRARRRDEGALQEGAGTQEHRAQGPRPQGDGAPGSGQEGRQGPQDRKALRASDRSRADRPLSQPHQGRLPPEHPDYAAILAAHGAALAAGSDTYRDPSTGLVVFTAGYLARRGTCCDSECRHCPYVC